MAAVSPPMCPVEQRLKLSGVKYGVSLKGCLDWAAAEDQNYTDGSETVPTEQFYPAKPGKG